jgi:hypothetical protein
MPLHICKYCNFSTKYSNCYNKHLITLKHKNNVKENTNNINTLTTINDILLYTCNYCNFSTHQKNDYNRHLITLKHKNNLLINNIIVENKEIQNDNIMISIVENQNTLVKQNEEVLKQNEELKHEIEKLKELNSQNTNKIVKEARAIKKSILTILNTNFKDTPSIDYIPENEFIKELELEYKAKINDKDDKLFKRIFNDFTNKKLVQTLANLIIKFVKKEDQKNQSVFNIDSARGNYATKIENFWHNDKSGLQLKKYTLDMVIRFMLNVLDIYRQKLDNILKQKKRTQEDIDYIMEYQTLFIEVRSFLTNVNTHKKVILFMCPELRLDQKMLDTITK